MLSIERKEKRYSWDSWVNGTYLNYPDQCIWRVDPDPLNAALTIAQGVGQGDRIGNKIRLVSAYLKIALTPSTESANNYPGPVYVRAMLMYDRQFPNTKPTPAANADFFQNGNGTSGFAGSLQDFIRPINKDRYAVKWMRDYKIGHANYPDGGDAIFQQGNNNDFKLLRRGSKNYLKYVRKMIKYNDMASFPGECGLYLFVYAVPAHPAQLAGALNYARLFANVELKFIDL